MNITCVIIDDEANVRELIAGIITDHFHDIQIAGFADSVESGTELINSEKPQLILLDIDLPDGTGFDILERAQIHESKVIFITAYDQYAIKAFQFSAEDYILKPVNILEFVKSVRKATESFKEIYDYSALFENLRSEYPKKVAVQDHRSILFINTNDIEYILGEGRYSNIFTVSGDKYVEPKLISFYDKELDPKIFFRSHKSSLINLNHVKSFQKTGHGLVIMNSGAEVNISRNKKSEFLDLMSKI